MTGRAEDGSDDEADELFADVRERTVQSGTGSEEQKPEHDGDLSDDDGEAPAARVLPDPGEPTASQMEDHRACGHIPYRSWCRECVEGRSTGEQHRKRKGARSLCVFSFDYLFLDRTGQRVSRESLTANREEVDLTILVAKDSLGKSVFGHVVPQKGVDQDHYAVDVLLADLKWLGYTRVSLRSDNERAILKLLAHAATEARLHLEDLEQLLEEHPNVYDSSGNGEIEVTVKQLTGVLRSNKLDLERRIGKAVPQAHPLTSWLVEYCAWMINVRVVGSDGLTAYQRVRGRAYAKRLVPFGELALVHLPPKGPERREGGALDPRAKQGLVLGYGMMSHSYCMYVDGVVRYVRSIQRMPLSQRWSAELLQEMSVTKQDLHGGRGARATPFTDRVAPEDEQVLKPTRAARRLELRQGDFDPSLGGFGWTEHCPKCDHARTHGWRSSGNKQHTQTCRSRIEAALAQTDAGRRRLEHNKERLDRYTADHHDPGDVVPPRDVRPEGELEVPQNHEPSHEPAEPMPVNNDDGVRRAIGVSADEALAETPAKEQALGDSDGEDADEGIEEPAEELYSPMSVDVLEAEEESGEEDGARAVINLCEADVQLTEAVVLMNLEILSIVRQLGADTKKYRRERNRQVRHLVSEIYSGPRVVKALKLLPGLGLSPGFSLDLTTVDECGDNWDFSLQEHREKALKLIDQQQPYCVIGSPSCTPYCALQALNAARYGWTKEQVEARLAAANVHLQFVCEVYKKQLAAGRHFLHEHPGNATSWKVDCIMDMMAQEGVDRVVGDQCQYGQTDPHGSPLKKPTGWMSSSRHVLQSLSRRCSGKDGMCSSARGGQHGSTTGRAAREAAIYPFQLCKAILTGLHRQLRAEGKLQDGTVGVQALFDDEVLEGKTVTYVDVHTGEEVHTLEYAKLDALFQVSESNVQSYRDGVTGQDLDPILVKAARREEMEFFRSKEVWRKRPRSEARQRTGKEPVTVKWIDTNKGDDENPNYRSRLVAREIRRAGEDPVFAPTPPLESLRSILSFAATDFEGRPAQVRDPRSDRRTQVSIIDI